MSTFFYISLYIMCLWKTLTAPWDTYNITATKNSYRKYKTKVDLEEGEKKEIKAEMKKTKTR
ncbi:hypothetical protein [Candidatus Kuenenia stuttgartiensis]|uniref:Uncharacterized protein n=1 Tax=Kuenenia stuttgartiensis TaxID=174633 RepID=Q1Q2G4_KUEST|nr:hypothetical protein [Candidatus Kuenenia stuttgartiensis]CAJ74205.1 unknown protein [Candidatus Kuenenia stuttgartiensis]